jgi:hypothetical protein
MAESTTGLFETLVSAASGLKAPLSLRKSMLKSIYVHDQPQHGSVGQTATINIPRVDKGNVRDIGAGRIQIVDGSHDTVNIVINKNPSRARVVREFTQRLTPESLRSLYLAPMLEEVGQAINEAVCALTTSGNFNKYTSITGGADVFTRPNVAEAWRNLRGAGVPESPDDTFFMTSHVPYSNMIGDDANKWISENIVGKDAAEMAQQTARMMPAFGAQVDYDQQFLVPSAGTYAGLLFHRNAIAIAPVVPVDTSPRPHVQQVTYQPEGTSLTFRIQTWYDPNEQGDVVHVHCMYGLAVVRPEYGTYLVTT